MSSADPRCHPNHDPAEPDDRWWVVAGFGLLLVGGYALFPALVHLATAPSFFDWLFRMSDWTIVQGLVGGVLCVAAAFLLLPAASRWWWAAETTRRDSDPQRFRAAAEFDAASREETGRVPAPPSVVQAQRVRANRRAAHLLFGGMVSLAVAALVAWGSVALVLAGLDRAGVITVLGALASLAFGVLTLTLFARAFDRWQPSAAWPRDDDTGK